jgi:hypothetical protein
MNSFKIKVLYTFFVCFFLTISQFAVADPPLPPSGHGATGNQGAGPLNGPLNDGVYIFLAFAAAYAGREWYKSRKLSVK